MNIYSIQSNNALSINSSSGQLMKWKIGDYYVKTSTLNTQSLKEEFMFESFGEVIASRIGKRLGLDIVTYRLCEVIIDDRIRTIACESREFKPEGYKEFSIGKLMQIGKIPVLNYGDIRGYVKLIESINSLFKINIRKYIDTILLFDSIILNDDRHFGNFGFMIKENHAKTLPLFDNGNSLFCHKFINELDYSENLVNYLRFKPFSINCNEQLSLIDRSILDKDKLIGIKAYIRNLLYEMIDYGLPKKRAKFIRDLLYSRIDYIVK